MNRASHNPSGSARQTEPLANQLGRVSVPCDDETSQISSAGQGREGHDPGNSCSSRAFNGDCAALVHELANTTTAVLMNAQVLGWKLPPYSHLKRPSREIERNAQRGSELMKCLLRRLGTHGTDQANEERRWVQDRGLELGDTVTAQEPRVDSGSAENLPPRTNSRLAPGFFSVPKAELTSPCDGCPSRFPKKG
ncbi:MAG: hypothetical protein ACHP8B_05415 [Terriglobales bacterium]